jgi:hypothetical protein
MNDAMEALAEALEPALRTIGARKWGRSGIGLKHDASGTPISVGYSHGPGGNFTFPGVDPAVFHTNIGNIGIIGQLPATPSDYTDPTFMVLTGVQADAGSEKTDVCDNAPTAGLMKAGMLRSVFGRYERATPELEINRLGQRNDRGDPMDLALVGNPLNAGGVFSQGARDPSTPADVLTNEISRKMWELNTSFHRLLSRQLWQGSPANNTAGDGYKELTGLDVLINTGHVDAETNVALPSIDSQLASFGNLRIDSNGDALVDALSYLYHVVRDRAERTGVMPVRWVFAMRPELFWELTAVWPCAYLTYRCTQQLGDNARVNVDAGDQVRFRDEMRAGRYLLLNGERIEVVLDDGIAFDDGNSSGGAFPRGCFRSDVYLIPMSVAGGRAVTYMEYFNYDNASIRAALGMGVLNARVQGPFMIWPRQLNTCFVFQAKVEPRLILRTPWLAGRLQNVVYCPTINARQPFPDDPYFVDGGKTSRPGPSYYALWQ